jgi:Uma2 family endonuclease
MSARTTLALLSEADYLEGEKHSPVRHEYVAGRVFAMSGSSRAHNRIAGNLFTWLKAKIAGTPCEVYMSDVKLRIAHRQIYYYPDLVLACDPKDSHEYYLERPCLVVEILSPSTAKIDRREKLLAYQAIPSLQAYVVVAQDRCCIEVYTPMEAGQWRQTIYTDAAEFLDLPCVHGQIQAEEVYAGVKFSAAGDEA